MQLSRGTERVQTSIGTGSDTRLRERLYLSRYYFQTFAKTFPNDLRVEEASFATLIRSSQWKRVWTNRHAVAIDELQLFMDRYPSSTLRDSSQQMMDNLRSKLEMKAFENARLYHKTGNFKSATIAMEHAIKDYPGSPYQEDLQFLIIDCHFQYAQQSTPRRKLERYNDAIQAFHTFASRFPESDRMDKARRLYDNSVQAIAQLDSETQTNPTNR